MEQLAQWHKQRHADVSSPFGDLALEQLIEITDKTSFTTIAGSWQPNRTSGEGLIVTFATVDRIKNEAGELVSGEVLLSIDQNYVQLDEHRFAMATAQPGSPFLLAIYNTNLEARSNFSHIESFPYHAKHSYIGKLKQADTEQFVFQHTGDASQGKLEAGRSHQSSVIVEVTIDGHDYALRPFASGEHNIIVFRDLTSNDEVYPVGRMLVLEQHEDDKVRLDFNKAFLPPCAFSPQFNCPMPPLSNRIVSRIEAGEKQVVTKSDLSH